MGTSSSLLTKQRRAAAAACCDRACGADLDLSLVIADGPTVGAADPAFEANTGVILMWSMAAWERWYPLRMLDKLMQATIERLGPLHKLWSVVYGPAAAVYATADRIGWVMESATKIRLDDGSQLDLLMTSPAYVKTAANKAVERWRWKQVDDRYPALRDGGLGIGAWWKPILSVLRQANSPSFGYQQKGALKSAIAGRQWAQQRLKQAKLVDDGSCQLCLDFGREPAAGTLLHRVMCPALKSFVDKAMPQWMRPHLRGPAEQGVRL